MKLYDKIWDFQNLYKAHLKAKKNKQAKQEVVQYEMNLGYNLTKLSLELRNKTYKIKGYYSFKIFDPKERNIDALYYRDRVVQHCLCDEVLEPLLDKRLIYDNVACRKNKGTHFALKRVKHFLYKFHKKYQNQGYFLKYDIKKFLKILIMIFKKNN